MQALTSLGFQNGTGSPIDVTVLTNETCVTVSGRPDVLAAFEATLPDDISILQTTLDALYHSPAHASIARESVMADVAKRSIRLGRAAETDIPIRSTFTTELVHPTNPEFTKLVVDMILVQPVHWDQVISSLVAALPEAASAHLINIGPGSGLTRAMERLFPQGRISSVDVSLEEIKPDGPIRREPIAIVGMAVDMPGAPDVASLWKLLEDEMNTIEEVSLIRIINALLKLRLYRSPLTGSMSQNSIIRRIRRQNAR